MLRHARMAASAGPRHSIWAEWSMSGSGWVFVRDFYVSRKRTLAAAQKVGKVGSLLPFAARCPEVCNADKAA
jgi:hypothetical protein